MPGENDGGTGAVETPAIVHVEDGAATGVYVDLPDGAAEPAPEGSEAVAIAEVEAARDVAVAEIQADAAVAIAAEETAQIEVAAEAANEGIEECRRELAELRTSFLELNQRVTDLFSSTLPAPEPEPPEEPNLSTPPFTSPPTNSMQTEAEPESGEEKADELAPPVRRRRRPI